MPLRHLPALAAAIVLIFTVAACERRSPKASSTKPAAKTTVPAPAKPTVYVPTKAEVSQQFQDASKARFDERYAIVELADGRRTMAPLASLTKADHAWLKQLASTSPLPKGKSSVQIVATTVPAKKTIETAKVEGTLETVQLCPPSVIRDQIGGTCMMYARVHWLDIAGYYVETGDLYKIINNTPPDQPWRAPHYVAGLEGIMTGFPAKPVRHRPPPQAAPFDWAREELRKGRPILAAFPREIWQALPPGFVAAHPWNGGSVGHQIVINGFTWDSATQKGTFHIVNSWNELMEFDLTTEAAGGGALIIEQSMSPIGEVAPESVKEVVQKVTLLKAVGSTNLYEVQTNLGTRRVAAASEASVYELVEQER